MKTFKSIVELILFALKNNYRVVVENNQYKLIGYGNKEIIAIIID